MSQLRVTFRRQSFSFRSDSLFWTEECIFIILKFRELERLWSGGLFAKNSTSKSSKSSPAYSIPEDVEQIPQAASQPSTTPAGKSPDFSKEDSIQRVSVQKQTQSSHQRCCHWTEYELRKDLDNSEEGPQFQSLRHTSPGFSAQPTWSHGRPFTTSGCSSLQKNLKRFCSEK